MYKLSQYSFLRVLGKWFDLLAETVKQWPIFLVYALYITLISAVFGRWTYACQQGMAADWCYVPSGNAYISVTWITAFYLLMFYLIGSFIFDIHDCMFKNSVFKWHNVWKTGKQKAKNILVICAIIISFIVSISMAVYIIRRPANPDFRIEFIFFLIAFMFLLVPMFMIRCSACFAYYMNTGSFSAAKVYDETSGKSYISVALFLLLMITVLALNMRSISSLGGLMRSYNNFGTALFTDFIGNLLVLISIAVFLMLFQAQYVQMEKDIAVSAELSANETVTKIADEDSSADTAPVRKKKQSVKSASKKKNKRKTKAK